MAQIMMQESGARLGGNIGHVAHTLSLQSILKSSVIRQEPGG